MTTMNMTMLNATKLVIVPVYKRPDMLAATLSTVQKAEGYLSWAFLFALDRGYDPAVLPVIASFPAVKQTILQPTHPYPGPVYNVLSAMKAATKIPSVETVCLLPEDYAVAPGFFGWHERAWRTWRQMAAADPTAVVGIVQAAAIHGSKSIACRSWDVVQIKKILEKIPEAYFLFSDVFVRQTWPKLVVSQLSIDDIVHKTIGTGGMCVDPGTDLARHIGFYTRPDSPAGLRWNREVDSLPVGKRAQRIVAMTREVWNEHRDAEITPAPIPAPPAPAPAPSAPDPAPA